MARLDRLEILRLSQLGESTASELYWKTSNILNDRLKKVCPNVRELINPRYVKNFQKRTMSALDNGEVLGGLVWSYEEANESLFLQYIGVDSKYKGIGAGKELMNEFERFSKEKELTRISLQTFEPKTGEIDLPSWYHKLGYERKVEYLNPILGRKYLLMEKQI